ncbi:MAG: hypothetical protein AAB425_07765, partial [Bdellovibrionota bacterium]
MITISRDQIKQVEYLIEQSIRGNHLLFDPLEIKRICRTENRTLDQDGAATSATKARLEKLVTQPSISKMREYLNRLDRHSYEQTLIAYLNIVENNLFEK